MKKILYIALLIVSVALAACNNDKSGWVEFEDSGFFVSNYGESVTLPFTCGHMTSFGALYYPEGWNFSVSLQNRTVTATAPADASSGEDFGEVTLSGFDENGDVVVSYITVGKVNFIALDDPADDRQANCMILTKPNTIYTFNANRRGEEKTEQSTKATSCGIYWRTPNSPIMSAQLYDDGSIGVYTNFDTDDVDDDGDTTDIIEGNALVVAYNDAGDIIWSWHLWITETDPTENSVMVNSVEFLPRNLGAAKNSLLDKDDDDYEDDILASSGLFYQWGRREPFPKALYYNAADAYETPLIDDDGEYIDIEVEDTTSSKGTLLFTRLNPEYFLLGEDWKYISDDMLWGSGGEKSIYDPSPKGWRVPSTSDFAKLSWSGEALENEATYGAYLNGELFMMMGRKVYFDGTIQNVSSDGTFKPGAGYYWSRDAVAGSKSAAALHFYVDRTDDTHSYDDDPLVVESERAMQRGNGMQIRSVRNN